MILKLALLAAAILACGWLGMEVWIQSGDAEMSEQGWIALVLGAVGLVVVGGGLMALVFWSSRAGYDDRAAEVRRHDDEP